jgi:hypothetical protein
MFVTAVTATSIDISNDPAMGNPKNLVPLLTLHLLRVN